MITKFAAALGATLCGLTAAVAPPAWSADDKGASWNVLNYTHRFSDMWGAKIKAEVRFKDDISKYDETVIKPGVFYYLNDHVTLGLGYKYQNKGQARDENDIWQELYLSQSLPFGGLTHQFRLEERFVGGISGVIPRARYLLAMTIPLSKGTYFAASEAVRFNLTDKGTGPVSGFEQNRVYFGLGQSLSDNTKVELGTYGGTNVSEPDRIRAIMCSAFSFS